MRNVIYIILIISLVFTEPFNSYTQNSSIENLKQDISKTQDIELVEKYLEIGNESMNKYGLTDTLLYYSNLAYNKSIELHNTNAAFKSITSIAWAYSNKMKYDLSNKILFKLLLQKNKITDSILVADIYYGIGFNYYRLDDNEQAMIYLTEAARQYNKENNLDKLVNTYCRITTIFSTEKQFDQCLNYINKVKALLSKTTQDFTVVTAYTNMAGTFVQIGTEKPAYLDTAIYYAEIAMALALKTEYYTKGSQLCNTISAAYNKKGNGSKGLEYLKLATRFNKYLFPAEAMITYFNLSDSYYNLKQYNLSLSYVDSVYLLLKEYPDIYYEMAAAERVYAYNKDAGNYIKAINGLEIFNQLKDSLYSKEKSQVINNLSAKYESDLKDAEIKNLNQQKELDNLKILLLAGGIIVVVLLLMLTIIFLRQRILAQKQKVMEVDQRLNRSRINPHFFFNVLAALQSNSLQNENPKETALYLSKYAKIMRLTLEGTYHDLVSLESEVEFIQQYLDLQKLRMKDKFSYLIKLGDNIEPSELSIPSMILQPFIENSIEHGFMNINYPGQLTIKFSVSNNQLKITIDDNGLGDATDKHIKEFPSRATEITKDRLFLLSKTLKKTANFEMRKKENENGFTVVLYLPIINVK